MWLFWLLQIIVAGVITVLLFAIGGVRPLAPRPQVANSRARRK
jgi:hypothetical protein